MKYDLIVQEDGSVLLPEPLLKHLGINAGDTLTFEILDDGSIQVNGSNAFTDFLSNLNFGQQNSNKQELSGLSSKDTIEDYIKQIRKKMDNE